MSSFGEKLKHERESRNTSIEEIAGKSKVELRYLEALERDEFDDLPGQAFGKFYIRVYAEVLGFDPEPLIAEYDQEQQRRRQAVIEAVRPEPAKPRRVEAALARWREAKWAERDRQPGASPPVEQLAPETAPEETVAALQSQTAELATEEPVEDAPDQTRDEPAVEIHVPEVEETEVEPVEVAETDPPAPAVRQWVEGGHDEAAAMASIFGATSPDTPKHGRRNNLLLVVLLSVALLTSIWAFFFFFWGSSGEPVAAEESGAVDLTKLATPALPAPPREDIGVDADRADAESTPTADDAVARTDPPKAESPTPSAGGLTVTELGVGLRVVNHRLEDQGRSFAEGSVVSFLTRVLGGERGRKIRHVWLYRDHPVQSIELELGGPHWRTHSSKTLWGIGEWAAEVRDADNRVLARTTFSCVSR